MKNIIYILFIIHFSAFANQKEGNSNLLIKTANKQSQLLEELVKSYNRLENKSNASKIEFDLNKDLVDNNIESLFIYAEDYGVKAIALVGEQSNAWLSLNEALKLPPTKRNQLRVFHQSKTLLAKNDKIINLFGPKLIKSASFNKVETLLT